MAPNPEHPTGQVRCRVCGQTRPTTADQNELLAYMEAHEASHDRPEVGASPSSATPDISTR